MSTTTVSTPLRANGPGWATAMRRITDFLISYFGGGPRVWKLAWVINFQKTGTFPFLAALIVLYHNTNTAAWVYLAMHGSYGLAWIIKDLAFPDPAWQRRVTIGGQRDAVALFGEFLHFGARQLFALLHERVFRQREPGGGLRHEAQQQSDHPGAGERASHRAIVPQNRTRGCSAGADGIL